MLDDGPYANYLQHWIDEVPKGTRKSYVCLGTWDEDCPMCDVGDSPSTVSLFNILDISNPKKPKVVVWRASVAIADQFKRLAESKRSSPLDREDLYFIVTPVKKGNQNVRTTIAPLDADKLEEYYNIPAFDDDELTEFDEDRFTDIESVTQVDDYDTLDKLVEEYL